MFIFTLVLTGRCHFWTTFKEKQHVSLYLGHLLNTHGVFSGGCKWIRTPAIIYSAHVATTLLPILSHILFYKFPMKPHAGPQTLQERLLLVSIYVPYLLVPLLLLLTMLMSSTYNSKSVNTSASTKKKKKWLITMMKTNSLKFQFTQNVQFVPDVLIHERLNESNCIELVLQRILPLWSSLNFTL